MEDAKFTIFNDEGKEVECSVLFTFDNDKTGKSYIVYTDDTLDEEGNTQVYASTYDPTGANPALGPIETEDEWDVIEKMLETLPGFIEENEVNDEAARASLEEFLQSNELV